MIKLNVDLQRCDANGTCAALMPMGAISRS